jgi:hypothetical protein
MSGQKSPTVVKAASRLSLDTWAVVVAIIAAALIRFGIIPRVTW